MSKVIKINLKKNLRRDILRGHPWVYQNALGPLPKVNKATLCQVLDHKNQFLAWGYYDPHNPIAIRILSTETTKSFNEKDIFNKFKKALSIRKTVISPTTNGFRLFNGEGDILPGLICDIYADVAVVQFDGQGPSEFWETYDVATWLTENTNCKTVINKSRNQQPKIISGSLTGEDVEFLENDVKFVANIIKGQKTGFFLDQRENRNYLKQISRNKTVLNLFSYTGGFSIYAGMGGASKVTSVDVSQGALDYADKSWAANNLAPTAHQSVCADVFDYLKQANEKWDYIMVDPPSMASSEKQKQSAMNKYVEAFSIAAKNVNKNGSVFFSSCSSHISFNDFFEVIEESLSKARRTGQILRVSGQGPDHPYPHVFPEFRYLKFVHVQL